MKRKITVLTLVLLFCNVVLADQDDVTRRQNSAFDDAVENVRATASQLILHAVSLLGVHYRYGGSTPESGFDCSGFVSHVFKQAAGVVLPRNAYQMSLIGKQVRSHDLQPGDLVFYNTLRRAFSHVGIYIGDNKFIHAPSKGKAVQIADMSDRYWSKRFQGARRVGQLQGATADSDTEHAAEKSTVAGALY